MDKNPNQSNPLATKSMNVSSSTTDKLSRPRVTTAETERYLMQLLKYRNISWRYLLCYCLPLQQQILLEQLRSNETYNANESESVSRKEEEEEADDDNDDNGDDEEIKNEISVTEEERSRSTLTTLSPTIEEESETMERESETKFKSSSISRAETTKQKGAFQKSISQSKFYHLPVIDGNALKTLFEQGREEYNQLSQLYLTPDQIVCGYFYFYLFFKFIIFKYVILSNHT
ncbi:Protein kinase domain containing protein [Reticulomyxa filosa]|uniref:Protein kinase domain containing protein n=1 Tax=Reticulomyxa filosa TaxID=46433 RepID=X6LY24_RETFI|nr:Protein kinase domain containing protein [Reticulomyxa filosa]|eukprot:ETO06509.1 Protein kinase domain containing protein [Reticulomyxa filosa]